VRANFFDRFAHGAGRHVEVLFFHVPVKHLFGDHVFVFWNDKAAGPLEAVHHLGVDHMPVVDRSPAAKPLQLWF
jgi:hypothetical protein